MRVAVVVEAVPPYCGGGEHVAWMHAVEMAGLCEVAVVTVGESAGHLSREGVSVYTLPKRNNMLSAYSTWERARLNDCIDRIAPDVIHCHMPNVLSACLAKRNRLMVSTIHDGVPETELIRLKRMSRKSWFRFKLVRRVNMAKSDRVTCVSTHNRDLMCSLYPQHTAKISFIPNPVHERYFKPIVHGTNEYVLNFGRQIKLKMGGLIECARQMQDVKFVFVGSGNMVRDYGLPNVHFVGFKEKVESYIDDAAICVFPSLSENFPLVGLEAMARGKPVVATRRGFSEYIKHMENGVLLDSAHPHEISSAITLLMNDRKLRELLGHNARKTAEGYRQSHIVEQYTNLYREYL